MLTSTEAIRVARGLAENYIIYCVACRREIVFYEWRKHIASQDHMQKDLALQEKELKKDPKHWVEKYWPAPRPMTRPRIQLRPSRGTEGSEGPTRWDTGETTRWCPICDRPIKNSDWFAHLESHRTKIKKPRL